MQRNRELLDLFDKMGAHDRERGGDCFVDRKPGGRGRPVCLDKSGPPIHTNFRIIVENSKNLDEPMGSPDSRVVTPPDGHDRGRNEDRLVDREPGGRGRPAWWDKYGPPIRTDYRIIVENLSSSVSWQDLKDFMRQAGKGGFIFRRYLQLGPILRKTNHITVPRLFSIK